MLKKILLRKREKFNEWDRMEAGAKFNKWNVKKPSELVCKEFKGIKKPNDIE